MPFIPCAFRPLRLITALWLPVVLSACSQDQGVHHQTEQVKGDPTEIEIPYVNSFGCRSCTDLNTALENPIAVEYLSAEVNTHVDYRALCSSIHSFGRLKCLAVYFGSVISSSELIDSLKAVPGLRELVMQGEQARLPRNLKSLAQLEKLSLFNTGNKRIGLDFLNDIPLAELEIADRAGFALEGNVAPNHFLQTLTLSGYKDNGLFTGIFQLTGLKVLIIDAPHLKTISPAITNLSNLHTIVIRGTPFSANQQSMNELKALLGADCVIRTDVDGLG